MPSMRLLHHRITRRAIKKKKESNPGPNSGPIKVEYQGLALFNMVDADHM